MDLEEFRRAYNQMDSLGNTPGNFLRRGARLAKDIGGISSGVKKDKEESKYRYAMSEEAKKEFKENGMSLDVLKMAFMGRRKMHGHTYEAVSRSVDSAVGVAMSANELGQTARSIVGTNGRNMYGGQDLEKGIHFALMAKRYTGRALRIPGSIMEKAEKLINTADTITRKEFDFGGDKDNKVKDKVKMPDLTKAMPRPEHGDIGR